MSFTHEKSEKINNQFVLFILNLSQSRRNFLVILKLKKSGKTKISFFLENFKNMQKLTINFSDQFEAEKII